MYGDDFLQKCFVVPVVNQGNTDVPQYLMALRAYNGVQQAVEHIFEGWHQGWSVSDEGDA